MNFTRKFLLLFVAGGLLPAGVVVADETNATDEIQSLKHQIEALDQKVRVLERKRELDTEAAADKAKTAPLVTIGANGFTARSGDTNFVFGLHGVLQVDNRTFFDDHGIQGNDGFLLRRARPVFQGTLYRDFDFMFVPDFGGTTVQIFDAYMNYRYAPWLQLRAGKFKTPVGLEQLQADRDILFNERALPTDLVPNRDIGFQLWGDICGGVLSYAAGVFNGVGDARNSGNFDFEDHREFAGRLILQPFKTTEIEPLQGLGFGVSGSWGTISSNNAGLPSTTGGTLAGFTTDGQEQFFAYNPTNGAVVANGEHWRFSPQGYYYFGPFGLMGEYVISDQRVSRTTAPLASTRLRNTAWEVTGSVLLTGENAAYGSVVPKYPFDPAIGHWGAVQLVGRYAELNVDEAAFPLYSNPASSASEARSWSVGVNWYLNQNLKLAASYSDTSFLGGGRSGTTPPGIVTRQPEKVFFTRLQVAF